MLHTLSLGAAMGVLWILLSGHFEPLLLGFGVVSVFFTLWVAHRMDVVDHEGHPMHLAPHALLIYWPWLAWEITKANWDVAKIIWSPKLDIQPHSFTTKATQKTDVGLSLYANSITLTPGTVTIDMDTTGTFQVHALTTAAREGVETFDMDKRCTAMEAHQKEDPKANKS